MRNGAVIYRNLGISLSNALRFLTNLYNKHPTHIMICGATILIVVGILAIIYLTFFWAYVLKGIGAVLANDCESRCFHDVIWSAIEYANEASADTWLSESNVKRCFEKCVVLGQKTTRSWTIESKIRFLTAKTKCLPGSDASWAKNLERGAKCRILSGILECEARWISPVMSGFLGQLCSAFRAVRSLGEADANLWKAVPKTCKVMFEDEELCA